MTPTPPRRATSETRDSLPPTSRRCWGSPAPPCIATSRRTLLRKGRSPHRGAARPLLLSVEDVCVGVAVGTDGFGHRIVRLDEQIPTVIPRERLYAVRLFNVRFGAEVILTDPSHLVAA